jgi:hypothetical protein
MRQFASQRSFNEPTAEPPLNAELMLLAIERALAPPVVHRRNTFQPMRIVVVNPTMFSNTRVQAPRVLPAAKNVTQFQHRTVRGEILSDDAGRLYEKLGHQIRPIHQLASGQSGEVIDLVPGAARTPKTETKTKEVDGDKSVEVAAVPQTTSAQTSASHRKLFTDPGQWRVVWWGEFKEILSRQLAHPERLRDTYRLPCYVQILETERTVAINELAAVCKSEKEQRAGLYLLTDEIAGKLDLVLPLRPAPQLQGRREPNTLAAHERVFRLLAANDPTIDVQTLLQKNRATPAPEPLKDSIPGSFVKEWDLKLTREEALYDMNTKPTIGSLISKFCRRLFLFTRRRELRKWQALLVGRSIDEQLWAVRPPAGFITDSLVREWAMQTLQRGGYDTRQMVFEWEIFWRRRGL